MSICQAVIDMSVVSFLHFPITTQLFIISNIPLTVFACVRKQGNSTVIVYQEVTYTRKSALKLLDLWSTFYSNLI